MFFSPCSHVFPGSLEHSPHPSHPDIVHPHVPNKVPLELEVQALLEKVPNVSEQVALGARDPSKSKVRQGTSPFLGSPRDCRCLVGLVGVSIEASNKLNF